MGAVRTRESIPGLSVYLISALAPCNLVPSSSPSLQPCFAVVPVVAVAREGRHRGRRRVAVLVRPFAVAEDRRSIAVIVKPKTVAASSSSSAPSVALPPLFWSPFNVVQVAKVV
uniref:Root cap protein 1-like n=1 Tax=Oryza sativa subsp. japonica TaxID=39947 RepID=Q5JNE2_ORYSJ|nr:root cap protein 1-like [Oryza sativa Japonica Group]